jgi:hypothetical protein
MSLMKYTAAAIACMALVACDGKKDDPKTFSANDLNPPNGLITMTGDKSITLRWTSANTEEDFQGFHVFGVKKKLSTVQALTHTYPKLNNKIVDVASGSLPRCADNTLLFEAFGFQASDKDCEGAVKETEDSADLSLTEGQEESAAAEEKLDNLIKCAAGSSASGTAAVGNDNISLPVTGTALGENVCVVDTLSDDSALANGDTYTFFVVAVKGSDFTGISWTSNFVEDTPRPVLFSGDVKIAVQKYAMIPDAKITAMAPFTAADITSGSCDSAGLICKVNKDNTSATAGLYIGRHGASSTFNYPQRLFLSTSSTSDITLELRGPQTMDPMSPGEISDTIPGDEAADTTTYSNDGHKFALYGNQVFDMKFVVGGETHYGKIVVHTPTLATATDPASEMTVQVTILAQTAKDIRHYLQ